jgi:hypothetical protein
MVATDELLCLKNAGTQISMFSPQMNNQHPLQLKKMKILGAVLELPANSTAYPAHLPEKWAKWAEIKYYRI